MGIDPNNPTLEFWCNTCESKRFKSRNQCIKLTKKAIVDKSREVLTKWVTCCDECGSEMHVSNSRNDSMSYGMKPTKEIKIGNERARIHGRDRTVIPRNFKEMIDNKNSNLKDDDETESEGS